MRAARDPRADALHVASVFEREAQARSARQPDYASWLASAAARLRAETASFTAIPAEPAQLELFA